MGRIVVSSVVLVIAAASVVLAKVQVIHRLPSYFPQCYKNDPELNKCLLDATNTVRPYLKKGIPELRIPPFEPFIIPEIVLQQGTRSLNFKAILKNVLIHGLTNYNFTQFDFDIPNLQFFCAANIGRLDLEGDSEITGRIIIAPIAGNGKFKASIARGNVTLVQKYQEVEKNGEIYLLPLETDSHVDVSGPEAHLDGLFGENKDLNEVTNRAINDNTAELFAELKPVVEHTLSRILEDVLLKSLMGNVPFKKLYPIK